jgi:hypothetical protein
MESRSMTGIGQVDLERTGGGSDVLEILQAQAEDLAAARLWRQAQGQDHCRRDGKSRSQ